MTLFSEDEIARAFDSGAFARGRAYQRDGRVRQLTISADGATISGSVHGNQQKPYSQVIGLKRRNTGALDVTGTCSCPVGHNCKHVAAVLLEHLARTDSPSAGVKLLPLSQSQSPSASSPRQAPSPTATLSGAVAQWLDQLAAASGAAATPKKTAKDSKNLVYVLNHRDGYVHAGRNHARLRAVVIRTRKDGSIAEDKSYDPALVTRPPSQIACFLTPDDIDLLRDMVWLKRADEHSTYSVDIVLTPDALGVRVLAKALASGGVRLGNITGPILTEGPAVGAEARWTTTETVHSVSCWCLWSNVSLTRAGYRPHPFGRETLPNSPLLCHQERVVWRVSRQRGAGLAPLAKRSRVLMSCCLSPRHTTSI